MATYVEIADPRDPRLADYRDLRDVQLRQSLEAEHGLFLAEGEKVVRRAVDAGFPVRSFLMAPRWLDGLADVITSTDAPCYVVSEALAEQVTGFHVHRGALASLARTPLPSLDEVLDGARTVLVCEDLVDHTNVGAIFRSGAALGVDAVLLAPRCADPLYRRSVKVAMGAVFALPWTRLTDWYDALPDLQRRGFHTVALTLADDAVPLEESVSGLDRLALILGTEGDGLSERWKRSAERRAVIPMRPGIDSLNVAAATAVACYVAARRRITPDSSVSSYSVRVGWDATPGEGSLGGLVAQVSDYAIVGLDPQGTIVTWNLGAEKVKGYTADEAIGRSFAMFYPEEDRRAGLPLSLLVKARDQGSVEHIGWRVRKDGTRFWGDVVITALHNTAGNLTGFVKVTRDLTEQHALESALRLSEERLRLLVGQVVDYAIIALDPQGIIESWNLGAEKVKGYTADEAIGRSFVMFYTDEDRRAGLPLTLLTAARDQGRVEHTGWRVRKDGTLFWGDVVITALHDAAGHLTGFAKVTRDRTEQHALETALRLSEERLRLLVGQVVDYAIIALDPQGIIESWNLGAERVKGYTADEAIGRSFSMFYTEEDRKRGLPLSLLATARETGRVEHTGWRIRKDGSRFWGDVVITAIHDEKGTHTGFAKVTRDRTDVKALEDAQDAFYATFNHDFRTPVTAIKGFVDAIRHADDASRPHLIEKVESSADRLLGMVEGLVEFATQRAGHASLVLADIDLSQVARSAVHDLSTRFDPARVKVADDIALATANGVAMHRVITNLVVNALKYSPPGSLVDISFSRARAGFLRMSVSDHGRGIDPGDLGIIFDEFVRGRMADEDGGSGLGLASVRELVRQQNGHVSIESEVGVGTTVTVELPSHAYLKPAAPTQRSGSSSETVAPLAGADGDTEASAEAAPTGHCSG